MRPTVAGDLDPDVRRLDVAVQDTEHLGLVKRQGHVADDGDLVVQRAASRQIAERPAVDELHRDVGSPVDLADLEDLADVRMIDARLRARLLEQAHRRRSMDDDTPCPREPARPGASAWHTSN
jgi:hypothetical protein